MFASDAICFTRLNFLQILMSARPFHTCVWEVSVSTPLDPLLALVHLDRPGTKKQTDAMTEMSAKMKESVKTDAVSILKVHFIAFAIPDSYKVRINSFASVWN